MLWVTKLSQFFITNIFLPHLHWHIFWYYLKTHNMNEDVRCLDVLILKTPWISEFSNCPLVSSFLNTYIWTFGWKSLVKRRQDSILKIKYLDEKGLVGEKFKYLNTIYILLRHIYERVWWKGGRALEEREAILADRFLFQYILSSESLLPETWFAQNFLSRFLALRIFTFWREGF